MTPEERWKEYEGWFIKGTFKDPEIAYGFIMQVQQAIDAEREACAVIAEGLKIQIGGGPEHLAQDGGWIASTIRARS